MHAICQMEGQDYIYGISTLMKVKVKCQNNFQQYSVHVRCHLCGYSESFNHWLINFILQWSTIVITDLCLRKETYNECTCKTVSKYVNGKINHKSTIKTLYMNQQFYDIISDVSSFEFTLTWLSPSQQTTLPLVVFVITAQAYIHIHILFLIFCELPS